MGDYVFEIIGELNDNMQHLLSFSPSVVLFQLK